MDVGGSLHRQRSRLGFSLEALAARSGVSRAMLSEIERGAKNPTIKVLCQVAEGLGCTVSDLIEERSALPISIIRRGDRQPFVDAASGVERQLLSPALLRHGIEVIAYTIPPGMTAGAFPPHRSGVLEHVTVVSCTLTCHLGTETIVLEPGDSVSYAGDISHAYANPGPEPGRFFLVIDSSQAGEGLCHTS